MHVTRIISTEIPQAEIADFKTLDGNPLRPGKPLFNLDAPSHSPPMELRCGRITVREIYNLRSKEWLLVLEHAHDNGERRFGHWTCPDLKALLELKPMTDFLTTTANAGEKAFVEAIRTMG